MSDLPINSNDAQPVSIVDSTSNTTLATIKAASTAAVATDTSLVIALSPNSPLPTGANTIGTVAATQSGTWNITNISGTISLPTGASTSALQTTGNTSLASIDTKTPALGQAVMASSIPVTIASNQSAIPVTLTSTTITGTVAVTQSTSPWVVSGTVTSNIGTTGGLALDATLAKLTISQGTALGTNTGAMVMASVTTAAPTYTTGQISPLSMDTTGNLRVTGGGVAQGSTTSGQSGNLIQGAVTTASPTYTTGQTSPLSLNTSGSLRTDTTSWLGSTAPTVGQKTMANSVPVVIASDQSGINTFLDKTITGTITALNGTVVLPINGIATVNASISGTWVATLVFEGQSGDGIWNILSVGNPTGGINITSFTTNNTYSVGVGGYTQVRIRASAFTSGTVNVTMNGSSGDQQSLAVDANGNQQVVGNVASGATDSGNPVKVGGIYNSTAPVFTTGQRGDLQLDASGNLKTNTADATSTGTITTTQNVALTLTGLAGCSVEITGTWTGTLVFEILVNATWVAADVFGSASSTELVSSSTTVNGTFTFVQIAGMQQVRVRGNTVATGTATVFIRANLSPFGYPFFAREQGATVGSYGVQMGGADASTGLYQFQHVNTLGAAAVYLESSNKASYSCAPTPVTPPATPTDVFTIYGSATKTVRITHVTLNSTQTANGINDWFVIKRSTANTGGTSTTITPVPNDSLFPAATAVVRRYTANPTALGTAVGNVAIVNIISPPVAPGTSGTSYVPYIFDFTNNPIVLRGVAEGLAINFNGAALPGGLSVNCSITFTEE